MSARTIALDDVARLAASIAGAPVASVVELYPHGTVRAFRAHDVGVRIDEDPHGRALQAEALALTAVAAAGAPALGPTLLAQGTLTGPAGDRRYLAYQWLHGRTLEVAEAASRAREAGESWARPHGLGGQEFV